MAATGRKNQELIAKSKEQLKSCKDPLEMLRLKCLERGANGIKGLGRYVTVRTFSIRHSRLYTALKA